MVWYVGGRSTWSRQPDLLPVNDALYQFVWYKRLQNDLNPDVAGVGESIDALIAGNAGQRPIYFAEELPIVPTVMLEETPPLWRYLPGD